MELNSETIMRDFLERWFNNINIRMWIKTLTREELEQYLKEEFENTLKLFENFLKQIQIQNLSAYLEIKKAFQQMYDINSKGIIDLYDSKKSLIV